MTTRTLTHTIWSGPPSWTFVDNILGSIPFWRISIPYRWVSTRWRLRDEEAADLQARRDQLAVDNHNLRLTIQARDAEIRDYIDDNGRLSLELEALKQVGAEIIRERDRARDDLRDVVNAMEADARRATELAELAELAEQARTLIARGTTS